MFLNLFTNLRAAHLPVSLREYLTLLGALQAQVVIHDVNGFYYLARAALVKDERHLDLFDQVFAATFQGFEDYTLPEIIAKRPLPDEWLQKLAEKLLSPEEMAKVQALGGFEALMKTLAERLAEQEGRHQGGNKWVGTAGTSPFGAYGYNPEGVRIGQDKSRHQRAVKVWDKRDFRDLDDKVALGIRSIKIALKRLRHWARDGAQEELDLPGTIRASADAGYIDVKTRPERRNAIKVLLFTDNGGSMDAHVKLVEELFSAARAEFKHLEHYYFHNCLYEGVWKDNARRWQDQIKTHDLLHRYGSDYKCIFVGDAAMSPYEILYPGGANEHYNPEPGEVWLNRARAQWPKAVWINPTPEPAWQYTQSTQMIRSIFEDRMYPMTIDGLTRAVRELGR
ncbi:vWA domain-containing protein [Abyssibius alkaniclasticus]|uniref:vWA domain-containing protein n=1 Tax=Abyssibius alkaniclasticus TaxID=2881234 RepID=UPI0040588E2E